MRPPSPPPPVVPPPAARPPCPTIAGSALPDLDGDGCREPDRDDDHDGGPDEGVVEVREGRIVVAEAVFFDSDSYRVRDRSRPVLAAIAAIVRDLPGRRVVIIEGHADQRGTDGTTSPGDAQAIGGWVRLDAAGHSSRIPEPPP